MACYPVYLDEAQRCNPNIVICSGRYDTLQEAQAACPTSPPPPPGPPPPPPPGPPTCCSGGGPGSLTAYLTVPGGSGLTLSLTKVSAQYWNLVPEQTLSNGDTLSMLVQCSGGSWTFSVAITRDGFPATFASGTLSAAAYYTLDASGTFGPGFLSGQPYSLTIAHPCPAGGGEGPTP